MTFGSLSNRAGVHPDVAELGWQAPACHSELELASVGISAASAKRSLAALSAKDSSMFAYFTHLV